MVSHIEKYLTPLKLVFAESYVFRTIVGVQVAGQKYMHVTKTTNEGLSRHARKGLLNSTRKLNVLYDVYIMFMCKLSMSTYRIPRLIGSNLKPEK